jgi:hypothetical protein
MIDRFIPKYQIGHYQKFDHGLPCRPVTFPFPIIPLIHTIQLALYTLVS